MKGIVLGYREGLLRATALVVLDALGSVLQSRCRHGSELMPPKGSLLGFKLCLLLHGEGAAAPILLARVGDGVLYLLIEI